MTSREGFHYRSVIVTLTFLSYTQPMLLVVYGIWDVFVERGVDLGYTYGYHLIALLMSNRMALVA
jgi:hypothetical protein